METEYLREYIAFSQSLNYAKTAEELFISQPALRSHIKALENEIGSPLVIKRKNRLEITMTGRLLLKHARSIVQATEEALHACKSLAKNCTELRIGTMNFTLFEELLTSAREKTREAHPEVEIDLRFSSGTRANLSTIIEGKADISILPRVRGLDEPTLPPDPGFPSQVKFRYLQTVECLFWMTKDNPLFQQETIHARDLKGQSLLMGNTDNMISAGKKLVQYFKREGASIEIDSQPFACYNDYVYTSHDGFGIVIKQFHPGISLRSDFRLFSVAEFEVPCDILIIYDDSCFDRCGQLFLEQLIYLTPEGQTK